MLGVLKGVDGEFRRPSRTSKVSRGLLPGPVHRESLPRTCIRRTITRIIAGRFACAIRIAPTRRRANPPALTWGIHCGRTPQPGIRFPAHRITREVSKPRPLAANFGEGSRSPWASWQQPHHVLKLPCRPQEECHHDRARNFRPRAGSITPRSTPYPRGERLVHGQPRGQRPKRRKKDIRRTSSESVSKTAAKRFPEAAANWSRKPQRTGPALIWPSSGSA